MSLDNDVFRGRLLSGERVLWSGRPAQGIQFTSQDIFVVPFSLVWCGIAISFAVHAGTGRAPPFPFGLVSLLFVGIGLYMVVGRFIVDALARRGMWYALTDRRVLISRGSPFSSFTSINLGQVPAAEISERSNGRGTIRFGAPLQMWSYGRNRNNFGSVSPAFDPTPQFFAIDNARDVFDLVQRTVAH